MFANAVLDQNHGQSAHTVRAVKYNLFLVILCGIILNEAHEFNIGVSEIIDRVLTCGHLVVELGRCKKAIICERNSKARKTLFNTIDKYGRRLSCVH